MTQNDQQHAHAVLELRAALDAVAGHAASSLGAAAVRRLRPESAAGPVRAELALVAEGLSLVDSEGGWPMPDIPEIADPLRRLRLEGYVLLGTELAGVARLATGSASLRSFLRSHADDVPALAAEGETLGEFKGLAARVDRAIGPDGMVADNASPELSRLRREIHGARNRIVDRLTEYASRLPDNYQVPDGSVSVREGRYVVPIRREGRGEVGGIVHGESQTGATLFVEPPIAIELMNRLRELEAAEIREVNRILRELTDELRPHAEELTQSLTTLVRIDTFHARARYASTVDGHLPEVFEPGAEDLVVVQGRHPLLLGAGAEVVPFDLRMEASERTLVISGPNTGGKTVLLKSLGLITLLTECGVIPPVGPGTRLPLVTRVFADIGDEQSIEASLSTFSAHLKNQRETLAGADHGSLVLIDEIGSGTDPVEGAALAQAILQELTDRNAFTVATTHLGSLKLMAAEDPRVVNASLQFDAEKLEPTYRLLKGVPGRSYGLAIARRLGLPAELLDRAEKTLPEGERDVGRLLLDLEAKEQRTEELKADLEARLARVEQRESDVSRGETELERQKQDAERRARQQARDLLMQSRTEVEAAIQQVREAADEDKLEEVARAARRRVEEAARRQKERTPTAPRSRKAAAPSPDLEIGGRVRIESLGRTATLLDLRDGKAVLDVEGLRMQLPATDVRMLPPGDQGGARPKPRQSRAVGARIDAAMDASPEVDLRGLRVEELELSLGRALDKAIVAGLPSFRIIHGKGTGALRAEVHDLLTGDPRITTFRPGERFEGGTGVTVVEFS